VTPDELVFRRFYFTTTKITLRADHKNIEDAIFPISALQELWEIKYVFCKRIPDFSDMIEGRLTLIQQELAKLQERLR
ncbi:MAG: transcriptional regulator, partial [Bacteroidota bacterium]